MRPLVFVILASVALAGCAAGPQVERASGGAGSAEPYYQLYRDDVGAQYAKSYEVPIDASAIALVAMLNLTSHSGSALAPPATPASLTLEVVSPEGKILGTATADAQTPDIVVRIDSFERNGAHVVRVSGHGASLDAGGQKLGATYALGIEVLRG